MLLSTCRAPATARHGCLASFAFSRCICMPSRAQSLNGRDKEKAAHVMSDVSFSFHQLCGKRIPEIAPNMAVRRQASSVWSQGSPRQPPARFTLRVSADGQADSDGENRSQPLLPLDAKPFLFTSTAARTGYLNWRIRLNNLHPEGGLTGENVARVWSRRMDCILAFIRATLGALPISPNSIQVFKGEKKRPRSYVLP
jgi:hypothetical protein